MASFLNPVQQSNPTGYTTPAYDENLEAQRLAAEQQAAESDEHKAQVQGIVDASGAEVGSYGYRKNLGMETSPMRWDQTNLERVAQQQGNYYYGGFEGGADAAVAAARNRLEPISDKLGMYGDAAFGQATFGAENYGYGMGGLYGMAGELRDYAQQGPGDSVAQAALAANTAQSQRANMALAGSGRGQGGGASNFRQALAQNATMAGQANAQASMLQAQEAQNWRAAQLQAMGQAGGLYGQGAGLGGEYAQGMGGLALQGQQGAAQTTLGQEQLANQIYGTALSGTQGYEQNLTDIYGISKGIGPRSDGGMTTRDWIGAGLQTVATVAPLAAASDIRAKTNIEPESALDAMGGAGSYSYNYLDPARHGEGTYVGPMAQELEGLPGVVGKSSDGTKNVDTSRLTLANTSALAELNQKVDALSGEGTPSDFNPYTDSETTALSGEEEDAFQEWARRNNVRDVDDPRARYDYRGFWRDQGGPSIRGGVDHFPDVYKQRGHPTFSVESRYSRGPDDGGRWEGERFIPAAKPRPVRRKPAVSIGPAEDVYTAADAAAFERRVADAVGEGQKPYTEGDAAAFKRRLAEAYTEEESDRAAFERRIAEAYSEPAAPGPTQPIGAGRKVPVYGQSAGTTMPRSVAESLGLIYGEELPQEEQDRIMRDFYDPPQNYQTYAL